MASQIIDPILHFRRRAILDTAATQWLLTGGGVKRVINDGSFYWTERFIAIGLARSKRWSTNGHFNIEMPPPGTIIQNITPGSYDGTVGTDGRIRTPDWSALWYIPPTGFDQTSLPRNFRVSSYYPGGDFSVPEDWVLIAVKNLDTTSYIRWGTGETSDYWRLAPLVNGWVNYANGFALAEYQMTQENWVEIRGLVKNGTNPVIFTLPVGYRPAGKLIFTTMTHPDVVGRLDIDSNGWVIMQAGNAGWFSICCSFVADMP